MPPAPFPALRIVNERASKKCKRVGLHSASEGVRSFLTFAVHVFLLLQFG